MLARVARNAAVQVLSLAVQFADRFLLVGILLRAWGTDIYSEWVSMLSCVGLLSLGELGLNIYYGNAMQKAWATRDNAIFQRVIATALTCSLTVALALGAFTMVALATVSLPQLLSVDVLPHSEATFVLILLALATLSRIARGSASQIFRGRGEFAVGILGDSVGATTLLLIMVAVGLSGYGPLTMAGAYLATDLVAGWGFMLWLLRRRYPDLLFHPEVPSPAELYTITRHVKWLSIQQGGPVAWLQVPVVILGYLGTTGPSLVSFVVLRTLVNFARSLGAMLTLGSGVETAATQHRGDTEAVARQLQTVGLGVSVLTTGMAVAIVLFGPSLVAIWTGDAGLYDRTIVLSLLVSAVIAAPAAPIGAHLMYLNAPRPAAVALLVQLAVGLTACAVLSRAHGVAGAAIGLAIGEALGQAVVLPLLATEHLKGMSYLRYCWRCTRAMAMTGAWSGLIGVGLVTLLPTDTWPGLLVAGALWALLGLIPALVLALPVHQRQIWMRRTAWRIAEITRTA